MKYGVMLRGENFAIKSEAEVENLGFFTTRFVKARSPEEAELVALNMIRTDKSLLKVLMRESEFESKIYLEKVWAVPWWKRLGGDGYTFYPMESAK